MKKYRNLFNIITITCLTLAIGCKKTSDPAPSAIEKQTELLAKTWKVETVANSVTLDGQDEIGNWKDFTVTFNKDKSYIATNISQERENKVWSSSGTWKFKSETEVNSIIRNDNVEMSIVVDGLTLKITFNYTDPGGRTSGITGAWVFNMTQ